MNESHYHFEFEYHGVGQGLFCSGSITKENENTPLFVWIYDCGSSSSADKVDVEIDRLSSKLKSHKKIDVLILSHFDQDHINKVSELILRFNVARLFIPYVNVIDRMKIAFRTRNLTSKYLEALISPGRYFSELSEDLQIFQIIGGDSDNPPEIDEHFGEPIDDRPVEKPIDFKPKEKSRDDNPLGTLIDYPSETISSRAKHPSDRSIIVSDSIPLIITGLWEFVFFNKKNPNVDAIFTTQINKYLKSWDWKNSKQDPKKFIANLKELYGYKFKYGRAKNDISLITYSGPVYYSWNEALASEPILVANNQPNNYEFIYDFCDYSYPYTLVEGKCSHLYFGDITLTKALLTKEIITHFTQTRWERIHVIQVPHHGAHKSWLSDGASYFEHKHSIFSYGLHNTYKHPGKSVIRDLHSHGPILVNEIQGCQFRGFLANEPNHIYNP